MKSRTLLKEIYGVNSGYDLAKHRLDRDMDQQAKQYFQAMGIEVPLPLQAICYNFCSSHDLSGRWLLQLDTGSGKTALCFAVACHYAGLGFRVFVVNGSEELTFRDYKKAEACCRVLAL